MKVWHLISNRWNSAISEYALSASRALRDAGVDTLVTPLQGSPIEGRFNTYKFDVESVPHFSPSIYPKIFSLAKKFDPNIIVTYGGPETTAAIFGKFGRRLIRFYGQRTDAQNFGRALIGKFGHLHVDDVLAPSRFVSEPLRQIVGHNVHVVGLGCDADVYKWVDSHRATHPEILIFGRLDPVKGHREFFPIFKKVIGMARDKGDPLPRLRIVGLPANLSAAHLWTAANSVGLTNNEVSIECEKVEDVASLMSQASLGLVSSLGSEVICRVAEEFLMCGTPVVSTNVGSLPEVFVDRQFGEVFNYDQQEDSASKIYKWLCQGHCESKTQRQSRASAAQGVFSIKRMSELLMRVISEGA